MTNKYQKHKEKLPREACERYHNLSKDKKDKRLKTDIKIFLKKEKRKTVSIIVNVIRIFLRNKSKSKLSI